MSRQFLPPSLQNADYNVADPQVSAFTANPSTLLGDIGSKMRVARAFSEGRVPSPVSRAYMFYQNLFGRTLGTLVSASATDGVTGALSPEREALRAEARASFRGVAATFALREMLGLEIELCAVPVTEGQDAISSVLRPALRSAPGGEAFWNPIRMYVVRTRGGKGEVLAGMSPLTGFFPAATAPRELTGLYWYDAEEGQWHDPTGDRFDEAGRLAVSAEALSRVRQLLKAWLLKVTALVGHGSLSNVPVGGRYETLIREELEDWREELARMPVVEGIDVVEAPIERDGPAVGLPFLEWTVKGDAALLLSDLPLHRGRLVVSEEQIASAHTRLYGRRFGGLDLEHAARSLPAMGNNLGEDLGLGTREVPMPFVCVDKLFTPRLAFVTTKGFSERWSGLEVEADREREYCLYPFRPEMLELMPPDELSSSCSAELSQDGQHYIVRLKFGSTSIRKLYITQGEGPYAVDEAVLQDTIDLRLFPDFDLGSVSELLPAQEDRHYFARARLNPEWTFQIAPFALEGGSITAPLGKSSLVGQDTPGGAGLAAFYEMDRPPTGFDFEGRGFCLYAFRTPVLEGMNQAQWDVGIDFGTSNTCVSYKVVGAGMEPRVLPLPVFTTSFLEQPDYSAQLGGTREGASAALDFFFLYDGSTSMLVGPSSHGGERDYFPTQFVTQQPSPSGLDRFVLGDGLVFFENISLSDKALWELIKGSPLSGKVPQRFHLKQDIKWDHTDWLRAFMRHLRKQVVLAAAHEGARIREVWFSYPKAFTFEKRQNYIDDVRRVWSDGTSSPPELHPLSESEAVREIVTRDQNEAVVLDVGGGTTDLIAFSTGKPVYQTSFEVAAKQVNEYVLASPAFRAAFVKALKEAAGSGFEDAAHLDGAGFEKDGSPDTVRDLWLGLLQAVERYDPSGQVLESTMNRLRAKAGDNDAVKGYFLSLTVLFGGLSYYAGQLMRSASGGAFGTSFPVQRVRMLLTGNGSKLYRMLTMASAPFGPVMERMFRVGLGEENARVECEGVYKTDGRESPKVTVALGLLNQRGGGTQTVPVANVTGEVGYVADGMTTEESSDLATFYAAVADHALSFEAPREAPPNLARFVAALGEALPYGKNGQFSVVPNAGRDWEKRLTAELYQGARGAIKRRAVQSARVLQRQLQGVAAVDLPALEPLFIAELAGLLEAIRITHADGH